MIWFSRLSAISQLASRVGGGGQNPVHIITLPGSGRDAGRGVAFPPLGTSSWVLLAVYQFVRSFSEQSYVENAHPTDPGCLSRLLIFISISDPG
jgi:hypothetical protein